MIRLIAKGLAFAGVFFSIVNAFGQMPSFSTLDSIDKQYLNWYNKDLKLDKQFGVSTEKANQLLLKTRTPKKKIVVAVMDCGTDILHPDLTGKIWINKNEIPGNNIDDDHNGYVDDINGWNWIGNSKGENIDDEVVEQVRIVRAWKNRFGTTRSAMDLPEADRADYALFVKCKTKIASELEKANGALNGIKRFEESLTACEEILTEHFGRKNYTKEDIEAIKTTNPRIQAAKDFMVDRYKNGFSYAGLTRYKEYNKSLIDKKYNMDYDPRVIIGDDPKTIADKGYGNNNVTGPRSDHGTFVAGIIAAIRKNGLGIDGIADNVEIMVLRTTPDGDERDKDIALALRYAADMGANIVNMSFGKDYSPEKNLVDDAVKYAQEKGVLLVHAAGNAGENNDTIIHFPTPYFLNGGEATTWLTVGANSLHNNKELSANFTNYGKVSVDLFAPGVNITSLAPFNSYSLADGTSFSAPVVSGVAALVWSYYPELSAVQLKNILLKSVVVPKKAKVYQPGSDSEKPLKVLFSDLSVTGGVVNAYQALKLAEETVSKK